MSCSCRSFRMKPGMSYMILRSHLLHFCTVQRVSDVLPQNHKVCLSQNYTDANNILDRTKNEVVMFCFLYGVDTFLCSSIVIYISVERTRLHCILQSESEDWGRYIRNLHGGISVLAVQTEPLSLQGVTAQRNSSSSQYVTHMSL